MDLVNFFLGSTLLLLLLAAWFRHTAGYCWAYNTRLYYAEYYPDDDDKLPWWLFADSLVSSYYYLLISETNLLLSRNLWSPFTVQ